MGVFKVKKVDKKYLYGLAVILLVLIGFGLGKIGERSDKSSNSSVKFNEPVQITSKGIYSVGKKGDIKSGNYYAVLTKMKIQINEYDNPAVILDVVDKEGKDKFLKADTYDRSNIANEELTLENIGDKYKLSVDNKKLVYLDSQATKEWEVQFLSKEQLTKWEHKNKKRIATAKENRQKEIAEKDKKEREEAENEKSKAAEVLKGKVAVPDPYFKNKDQVAVDFKAAGLTPKFVKSNFDGKAISNECTIRVGDCDQLDSEQSSITYYDSEQVGIDAAGYYADKGATVTIGYSDHDYDGTTKTSSSDVDVDEKTSSSTKTGTDQVFDNQFVTISYDKDSNYFSIKNRTSKDIILGNGSGPLLNGHLLNMYDGFASVDVPANGSVEETLTIQNEGETLGGDKLHEYDYVQSGDNTLHVAGEISDSDFNTIGNYSFDAKMSDAVLKD